MILRIHGDNIIECERALQLIQNAYQGITVLKSKNLIMPSYSIVCDNKEIFEVELLGGHDRWNVDFNTELTKYGAPLREATDAYITRLSKDRETEELLLAIEFCNALPAGNNAWQRNGRAVTCAEIGIPYFYIAEIGGVELDSERKVKAPRFPNPIVPFSYLAASKALHVICIPVYQAHPAITPGLRDTYTPVFGIGSCLPLLRSIIDGKPSREHMNVLIEKGISLVKTLSNARSREDSFRGNEWDEFLQIPSGIGKSEWIKNHPNKQVWRKKSPGKISITPTFQTLLTRIQKLSFLSIGAKDIPICLVTDDNTRRFVQLLREIYPANKINELTHTIEKENKPILIVWITGFKPGGDDSRPDRGLVPLARMLFGNDIDILTIIYGPAPKKTWRLLKDNPAKLLAGNGLWQSILQLSNYVLADSSTSEYGALASIVNRNLVREKGKVIFRAAKPIGSFGEHDVDTAIHTLFSRQLNDRIFESMCNPPGGDWSGISYWDFNDGSEYRWTSLPRVSATQAKRPDHIIHINTPEEEIFLVIESKNSARNLDENIGNRLTEYVKVLFRIPPTAYKLKTAEWRLHEAITSPLNEVSVFSGGAFCYTQPGELRSAMTEGNLDFIIAFEFNDIDTGTVAHLLLSDKCKFLYDIFTRIASQFSPGLKVKIH